MMKMKTGILAAMVLVAGCATVKRLPPPDDLGAMAEIPGMPQVRFWGDEAPPDSMMRIRTLREQIAAAPSYERNAPVHFLALSGGGQNGAFGAGLLAGWTASGTRPEFRMVTGISTGSLIAPFAFLGSEYDAAFCEMYTKFSTKDVLEKRVIKGLLSGDSVTDNSPLRKIVSDYFTPAEMALVAQKHAHGRRLLIGTTYLDVQRPIIWDIGAIASSGDPDAYDLIIDVLLASAAIPGAFPPVYFKVEQNGRLFDEMHVDGGVTTQVFVSPVSFKMAEALTQAGLYGKAHIYMIRNGQISPDMMQVKPKTVPILSHSLSTLLRAQGLGDMYRIYQNALLNNMEYNAAYIPSGFREEPSELFDIKYMSELFALGYEQAKNGYPWERKPPEFKHGPPSGPQ